MGKTHRILVVDDDPDILELLQYNLEKEGFQVKIEEDALKATETAIEFLPELVILDIMMPGISGIEVCKRLRKIEQFKSIHIFFLTGRSEPYYQEAAFETGGDDYIEKVMGLRSLTLKVIGVLRKKFKIRKRKTIVSVGGLKINRRNSTAKVHGNKVALSKPELELLYFFAQNPKKVVTAENLLNNIWYPDTSLVKSSINNYLENLAEKLGGPWIIDTGNGRYRFSPH
jgi:two-component system, OmpR family, alkaline phosphatase synthesis response regulator PhoP